MPHNRGTRHKPKYVGVVSYKDRTRWVGTHARIATYRAAEQRCLAELREEVEAPKRNRCVTPTVLEFAGAVIHEDGRVTMSWPGGQRAQKETGRKPSSVRRMREALRPFVREFGERRLDSFGRDEAMTWALAQGRNVQQAVRQFFNHAIDRELINRNPFARLGASKRRRRIDRPDFEPISHEQYQRLRQCARHSRADDYGLIIEGTILAVGEAALRPSEAFALHHSDIDFTENVIYVRRQWDATSGGVVWPKDDDRRWVIMSPALREHLQRLPCISQIVLPAPRGGYMSPANWSKHWHAVRAAAGMPGQGFYELKHRAIQWMVDPVEDGGLGLDPPTVAQMVGHDDGGYLIATVYTKLAERRARDRAQRAIDAYAKHHTAPPASVGTPTTSTPTLAHPTRFIDHSTRRTAGLCSHGSAGVLVVSERLQ
jgi:integrase